MSDQPQDPPISDEFMIFTHRFFPEMMLDYPTYGEWVVSASRIAARESDHAAIRRYLAMLLSGRYSARELVQIWEQGGCAIRFDEPLIAGFFRLIHASIGTDTPALELSDRILGAEGRAPIGGLPD